jgi:hypothetical protein
MVQGEKVSSVKSIKFVSLQLNSTLDCENEINAIVKKCENLDAFHDLCEAHLVEVHPVILLRLYKAHINNLEAIVKQSPNGPVLERNVTSSQEETMCPSVILVCQAITNGPVAGRIVKNQCRAENEQSLANEYYKNLTPLGHLIQPGNCHLCFNYTYKSLSYEASVSFDEG